MKDPSTQILSAFTTALGSITYNSETIPVYDMKPGSAIKRYILLNDLSFVDALSQDQNVANCTLDIEVVYKGQFYQGSRAGVNSISNDALVKVIKKKLTMTGFTMTVTPFLRSATITKQYEGSEIILTKVLTVEFNTEES
jgi:hypothetical protein